MHRRCFRVRSVLLYCLLISLIAGTSLMAQESATLDEVCQVLKLTEAETQALKDGKFIQREAEETSKKELAALLVVLVPRSFDEVVAHVANLDLLRSDRDVVAYKDLGGQEITPDQFRDAVFTAQEGEEVRKLSNAGAGSTFNLSKGEIASLQSLRSQHSGRCDRDPACVQAFNAAHSDLLYERMMAYRRGGLSAVAPYQREKNAAASPADELRGAGEALAFLKQQMPSLYKAFMEYPASQIEGVEHSFLWKKQSVQDRPTFALSHRMVHNGPDGLVMLAREFYVGQSYNSLLVAAGAFPQGERTLVVYVNRTSTDQVAGFASGTRHAIGRKMMISEIKKNFEDLKARFEAGS